MGLKSIARELDPLIEKVFTTKKRPFVAIQFGVSLDGKIATRTGDSKWINNEKAREFNHKLRGQYEAILVGVNTIIADNPHLGTRSKGLKDPLRIIIDPTLRIPLESLVLRDTNVLIATTQKAEKEKLKILHQKGIAYLTFNQPTIVIKDLLAELKKRNIQSVFVEGGATTLGYFIDEKLVDKVYAFYAPLIIGGKNAISAIGGLGAETVSQAIPLVDIAIKKFGTNIVISGYTKI